MSTLIDGYWLPSNHADPRAIALYPRHYSARHYRDGRKLFTSGFCPPGEKMVLLTEDCRALFAWHTPVAGHQPAVRRGGCMLHDLS